MKTSCAAGTTYLLMLGMARRLSPRQVREKLLEMVSDPVYLQELELRLRSKELHPSLEKEILQQAIGKAQETIRIVKKRPLTGDETSVRERAAKLLEVARSLESKSLDKKDVH